jgi:hypothetical protein
VKFSLKYLNPFNLVDDLLNKQTEGQYNKLGGRTEAEIEQLEKNENLFLMQKNQLIIGVSMFFISLILLYIVYRLIF